MLGSPFGFSNWEPILFYGTTRPRGGDVVVVPIRPDANLDGKHPVPKQIDLARKLVELLSDEGHHLYEPFCGSGTTLIACEQLRRRCYAIEIQSQYVQVALDRWEAFT